MAKTFSIISLGCPRNLVDSEFFVSRLYKKGYFLTEAKDAETILINTCAFIDEAKKESIDVILEALRFKKRGCLKRLIVFGCFSQRYKASLVRLLKGVDAFLGRLDLDDDCIKDKKRLTPKQFAYLKIAEGCINKCSYCVIPSIKGKFKSRQVSSILKEVIGLDRARVSEINLIGQDISCFGLDLPGNQRLDKLLRKISLNLNSTRWIRLLYLHPRHINNALLKEIAKNPKICKYIDLPIQHINDRILKAMNRRITKDGIIALIAKIRRIIPGVAIRTSLIVGFPGETDKEFQELVGFVKSIKFNRLGVFTYSREEDTPAFNLKGQIKNRLKNLRRDTIMKLQRNISLELNSALIGKYLNVLIEERSNDGFIARSEFDAPEVDGIVYVKTKKNLMLGQIVKAKIVDAYEYDLVAQV